MKTLFVALFIFAGFHCFSQGDPDTYLDFCSDKIKILSSKVTEGSAKEFKIKNAKIDSIYVVISEKKLQNKKHFSKEYQKTIFPFGYLNEINDHLLPAKTELVNSLGRRYIEEQISNENHELIIAINGLLEKYRSTKSAKGFVELYGAFLLLKNRNDSLMGHPPKEKKYTYEPIKNAYSSPIKIKEYIVYDWEYLKYELELVNSELKAVKFKVKQKEYSSIKEPLPAIPIMFQMAALLVLISNLMVNFNFNQKLNMAILVFVSISVIVSFVLLFFSSNTLFNAIVNIFVPGIMYLLYYKINKTKKPAEEIQRSDT